MKDRTSFTLHTVDNSGHGCSVCSLDSCNGCLVRIDDNVRITRDTNVVVHFDDLAEESKKSFGTWNFLGNPVSNSQGSLGLDQTRERVKASLYESFFNSHVLVKREHKSCMTVEKRKFVFLNSWSDQNKSCMGADES